MNHFDEITTSLKLLSDSTRLRILSVLRAGEFTVKELTDILSIGQSTLSTQLGQLKEASLVSSRKQGQFVLYRISSIGPKATVGEIVDKVLAEASNADWHDRDQRNIQLCLDRRKESSLGFFGSRTLSNVPSPGQTWESLAVGLINVINNKKIADLGCGTGRLSARLAEAGNTVIGVDNSKLQIDAAKSLHHDLVGKGLEFLCEEAEHTSIASASLDLVILSHTLHHAADPKALIAESFRILKTSGSILILDLVEHNHEWIQEKFGDFWLGFSITDLSEWLASAGFQKIKHAITIADPDYPEIEPLIISASKP